jgi:hypothetical protein
MPDMRIARAQRAQFESVCSACGEKIAKGAAIVKHVDTRKHVHARCQFNRGEKGSK